MLKDRGMSTAKIPKKVNTTRKDDKEVNLSNWDDLFELVKNTTDIQKIKEQCILHIKKLIEEARLPNYQIQFLYDEDSITEFTQNRLYSSFGKLDSSKDLLLVIDSRGGEIEPAYFISKAAKKFSQKFIVVVPRKAKSAATLISLGADEIHMGIVSELGPIDPQINGMPALGVSNAVGNIASICQKYPGASNMLAKYLALTVEPTTFGYYERIVESAVQYAERLLSNKTLPKKQDNISVWSRLVYEYKDHSFVIDYDEAKDLLGNDMVKTASEELKLGESLYNFLDEVNILMKIFKNQRLYIIGDIDEGLQSSEYKKKEKNSSTL
jgi:hypothetical protein